MEAFIYRNESEKMYPENHYLKFILQGEGKNLQALGTKITIEGGGSKFYLEQMPMRGFESTVDSRPNFGLGTLDQVEKISIEWPDGKVTEMDSVKTNQTLSVSQKEGKIKKKENTPPALNKLFSPGSVQDVDVDFKHTENDFVDFDRDRLIYHMLSTEGPKISVGDVNGDGLDDFYIGGAKDQPGALYAQNKEKKFKKTNVKEFEQDKTSEDLGSEFFDADGDGDLDLYVCSGGNEFSTSSAALLDRLYINDGKGNFKKSSQLLPTARFESTSCVKVADYDHDGDMDLFVGIRLEPFRYGVPMNGYLLNNDGKGNFKNVTDRIAPGLLNLGMITDALWADIDGDKDLDLIVVGEWMPISVFVNEHGKFVNRTKENGLFNSNGWWNTIEKADIDHDGDMDFIAGNHGLNSRFRASMEKPVTMYVGDFDRNGSIEQIVCTYNGEKSYPMVLRHDLVQQIPNLKKKYLKYESYKDQTITDIFTEEQLNDAIKLEAFNLSSCVAINDGKGKFTLKPLPVDAQLSPMYGVMVDDFDRDGNLDVMMGGNLYRVKPEVGRYDASYGVFLKGDGTRELYHHQAKRLRFFCGW